MRTRRRPRKRMAEINVVPYIDVMLVLLIIFMVTTPLLSQGVKVNLPHAAAKKLSPTHNQPLIITVNARGQYFLNKSATPKTPIAATALTTMVKAQLQQNPKRKVYVRGDRAVDYGKVVQAMVLLQKAGAGTVGLMTDNPQQHS